MDNMTVDYDKIKEEVIKELEAEREAEQEEQQKNDTEQQTHITKTDFHTMTVEERIKLKKEYPEAYDRLR